MFTVPMAPLKPPMCRELRRIPLPRTPVNKELGAGIPLPVTTNVYLILLGGSGRGSALRRSRTYGWHLVYAVLHQSVEPPIATTIGRVQVQRRVLIPGVPEIRVYGRGITRGECHRA